MCAAIHRLHHSGICHFDIKADNVLIDASRCSPYLPFSIRLADFGECKVFNPQDLSSQYTVRNRGTECIKSPEMLQVSMRSRKESEKFDRRKDGSGGVGLPSDVWSLGCLLFEIVAGKMLFENEDWILFYIRVTDVEQPLIDTNSEEYGILLEHAPIILSALEFILVRDPLRSLCLRWFSSFVVH